MKIYIYQNDWYGHIEMVSKDGMNVYKRAWDDFCTAVGKERAIVGFPNEESAFISFMENGGIDDWEVTEWDIEVY